MTDEHRGEVALVTGGARGIGRAIALGLAAHGTSIALIDAAPADVRSLPYARPTETDLAEAAQAITGLGAQAAAFTADVRRQGELQAAVVQIERDLGPVTHVVAAAAVGSVADAGGLTDDEWDDVVDTNLHGLYNIARVVTPLMVERRRGRILAIVGDEARRGVPGISHIAAASWAVVGLAKSIALEVAPFGVGVNVLCAGPMRSAFTTSDAFAANVTRGMDGSSLDAALATRHPNDAVWVSEEDAVAAATFLLRAPTTAMTGSVLDVTNGMAALNSA